MQPSVPLLSLANNKTNRKIVKKFRNPKDLKYLHNITLPQVALVKVSVNKVKS